MQEDTSRTERFYMRFMALSASAQRALREALPPTTEIRTRTHEDGTTVIFQLSDTADYEPLYRFLDRSNLDPATYSVWISVVTESDHSGVSVPNYVLKLIRRIRGGLDYSFVALGPELPDD